MSKSELRRRMLLAGVAEDEELHYSPSATDEGDEEETEDEAVQQAEPTDEQQEG